jgi:hypothetical protein
LGNLSFVPGWFKFNFTLDKVFNIEDRLIGACRFQIDKKHRGVVALSGIVLYSKRLQPCVQVFQSQL